MTLPPDPIQEEPTYEGALAAFEALPPIRILFDNGAGGDQPGQPQPGFEHSFAQLPGPGHHGALLVPRGRAASSPTSRPRTRAPTRSPGTPTPARSRTSPATPRPAQAACGRRRRRTSGRSNPAGTRGLVRDRAARREHDRHRRRRRARLGAVLDARTSTSRPRSPRCGPTARRRSSRAAGCAATMRKLDARQEHAARARAQPARSADVQPMPRGPLREGRRSRSTTRATPTAPDRASA